MTLSLGVPRLGDTMGSIGRGLTGRIAAASLAVLAIIAGAATFDFTSNCVCGSADERRRKIASPLCVAL